MEQDRRSQILQDLGVRTWRGAAVFGMQAFAIFLPVFVAIKVVGGVLGIDAIVVLPW